MVHQRRDRHPDVRGVRHPAAPARGDLPRLRFDGVHVHGPARHRDGVQLHRRAPLGGGCPRRRRAVHGGAGQPRRLTRRAGRGQPRRRGRPGRCHRDAGDGNLGGADRPGRNEGAAAAVATSEGATMSTQEMAKNAWRLPTPGVEGWTRTARPDDPNKYYMVSADCHVTESLQFLEGVDDRYRDRIPHFEVRDDGAELLITEGNRPQMVKPPRGTTVQEQQTFERPEDNRESKSRMEDEDLRRVAGGRTVEQRLADQAADGVDVEIVFPTAGLLCWATPDPQFAMTMCAAWNRWVLDQMGDYMGGPQPKMLPMALIAAGDQDGAMREIEWAAARGFRGVCLGNSPTYGPTEPGKLQYNDPSFEDMWSLLEDTGLVITFHVSTGKDPRSVGGRGGAIINYVCHSMETTIEPLVQLITAGV